MKRFVLILCLLLTASLFVQAQKKTSNIELYPVPLKVNELKVRMMASTAGRASKIELRNFIGKKLQTLNCDGKKNYEFTDMRQYPEGVYVVLVKGKNGKIIESSKFMIAK